MKSKNIVPLCLLPGISVSYTTLGTLPVKTLQDQLNLILEFRLAREKGPVHRLVDPGLFKELL